MRIVQRNISRAERTAWDHSNEPLFGDSPMHRPIVCFLAAMAVCIAVADGLRAEDSQDWKPIFNGKSLDGWRANEHPESWTIQDGVLVGHGPTSHLFYTAEELKDFELKTDVMINHGGNSGIYFHVKQHGPGWFFDGHEVQINNTHVDPVRTGSLWHVVQFYDSPVKDDEWFAVSIRVKDRSVLVQINGKTVVEYLEPEGITGERKIGKGYIALQQHDPASIVRFRNILLKTPVVENRCK